MQHRQKCCAHCPGNRTSSTREIRDDHYCGLPRYVRGNLELSSLRKMIPGEAERSARLRGRVSSSKYQNNERPTSCYDRFAIAKKFHAENLQHQPLPDKVDDSIFKNFRTTQNQENSEKYREKLLSNVHRDSQRPRYSQKIKADFQYGPVLGCKTPTTNMDLAICWEAPLDPTYEPSRAIHIDGTDGGPAPAIFTLVEPEVPLNKNHRTSANCFKNALESYEAKFSNVRNRCRCTSIEKVAVATKSMMNHEISDDTKISDCCEKCSRDLELLKNTEDEKKDSQSLDKDLCHDLLSCHISDRKQNDSFHPVSSRRQKHHQPVHLRHCSPCECRGDPAARKPRQRLTQSAHSTTRNIRRNGLPTKNNVPRPRTPYAKRSFCIDTLTPPFSIVNGCRDADYPEHWRLTSVYQQSYRNPRKQRGTILNYT